MPDFNDVHVACGLDEVKRQLYAALNAGAAAVEHVEAAVPQCAESIAPARSVDVGGEAKNNLPDWQSSFKRTSSGAILANIYNITLVLTHDERWAGVLAYCDFSYRIIKRKRPPFGGAVGEWEDADTARLRNWVCEKFSFAPKTSDADDAVMVVAQDNRYHPVRDYLGALRWDGKRRLDTWLQTYLGVGREFDCVEAAENYEQYVTLVGRMFLIAAVARVMRSPVKVDSVLILEGEQGRGKSTAMRVLGGDWFSDTHFALGDKDGYQQMQGVWICELAELDSFNKAENTRAKQFFSSASDRYRPAYGRRAVEFARQCVFVGTTNQDQYFKDPTGNRRYWPVRVGVIDLAALERDRDQLFAEACVLYGAGERWHVEEQYKHLFAEQQEQRYASDVWEDIIVDWLRDPTNNEPHYTTNDIMSGALQMDAAHMRQPEQTRVGLVMSRLGWKKERPTVTEPNGKKVRKWVYIRPAGWE